MSQRNDYMGILAENLHESSRIAPARRFDAIGFKIILGLQCELREIERRGFQNMPGDAASSRAGPPTSPQSSADPTPTSQIGDNQEQLVPFDYVRKKMETYHEFVLRFAKLYSLPHMDHIDRDTLHEHLSRFQRDYPESMIDTGTWTDDCDLVGVFASHLPKWDRFTRLMIRVVKWVTKQRFYAILFKAKGDYHLNEEKIAGIVIYANLFIASLLNILALYVLYAIKSTLARIGTICVFSLLFSLSAHLFTVADPIMIYSSTAAYSAVLIVFIGNVN